MHRIFKSILVLLALLALSSCGGAGGTGFTPTYTYAIGGTIVGLQGGKSVVLQNNLGDNLTRTANGSFTFATRVAANAAYSVTVLTDPVGQTCAVTGGDSGTGSGTAVADVTTITVTCTPIPYTVGGTITGLTAAGLVLQNNGGDDLTVASGATTFTFATSINSGSGYGVTVLTQPTGLTCSVTNGFGTVAGANITDVAVSCSVTPPPCGPCTIGGTLTGFQAGSITLQNNLGNNLTRTANGSFTFATGLASGAGYSVTVLTPPANQNCSVTYGAGTVTDANITDVNVFCGYVPRGGFAPAASFTGIRSQHTATLITGGPAAGKVLVVGGYIAANTPTNTAQLYDPLLNSWSSAGTLTTARYQHTATLLNDGTNRVLVVGGTDGTNALASAELYDPATNTWSPAGPLGGARYAHTATLLASGNVLVVGGDNGTAALSTAEVYTPVVGAAGSWTNAASLTTGRLMHTATLLSDGRVLVVGGNDGVATNDGITTVDLYNPGTGPGTDSWAVDAPLTGGRFLHTATLLASGKVLVAGGYFGGALNTAEVYTPAAGTTGAWVSTAGNLSGARYSYTATLLNDGTNRVLVAGGYNGGAQTTAEFFDPTTTTWSTAGSLAGLRYQHAAVLLSSGKVLVTGGNSTNGASGSVLATAELYDTTAIGWSATGSLSTARYRHTATLIASGPAAGKVLVAGGWSGSAALATSQLYDPSLLTWSPTTGGLTTGRYDHTATLLSDGRVLVVGGTNGTALASAEIYDPTAGTWSAADSLNTARSFHTATLLRNGKVLVAGGTNGTTALQSAELYDPVANSWSYVDSLTGARYQHTATLLPGGKVLVAGGAFNNSTAVSSAEVFDPDPAVNTWSTATGAAMGARAQHTATLLPNGKVLVAGGVSGTSTATISSAALYTPSSNSWAATGSFVTGARSLHTATLLPSGADGKVLVAGGTSNGTTALSSIEIYDVAAGTWASSASLGTARYQHTATLLVSGKLLVTGGWNGAVIGSEITNTAELGW